jgi:acetoin utilization deacetylase AcuC-like enzyme
MIKYDLLYEQLLYEGVFSAAHFFEPQPLSEGVILLTHDPQYWARLKSLQLTRDEIRKTGFPLSALLVHRERIIMSGTVEAAIFALQHGVGLNIAGGTHHAHRSGGAGFCLLNDNAIAANYLLHEGLAARILIVDLDVHQGDGTATIFQDNPDVFTFSMHGANNFPMQKQPSDMDIALDDGTRDAQYLRMLSRYLDEAVARARPEFVFYQCGVDVIAGDKLGRLALMIEGCRQRDKMVMEKCKARDVPMVASMGGGYSDRLADIIEAHANTFRLAKDIFDT